MKFIKIHLVLLFLFALFTVGVHAQNSTMSIVAVEYETRDDIDFLFQNSTQVLEYLEGIEIEAPTFLSLVTDAQKRAIESEGYSLRVLAENADLDEFVLLYNPQPDQAESLSPQGEPIVISSRYTLLKLAPGEEFSHDGAGARFFEIPFSTVISPPPLRTKTAEAPLSLTPPPEEQPAPNQTTAIIAGIIAVLGLVAIIGVVLWVWKRRKVSQF